MKEIRTAAMLLSLVLPMSTATTIDCTEQNPNQMFASQK